MTTEVHGNCLCKAVSYTFHSPTPELKTLICYCDSCQRLGGSPFSFLIATTVDDLKVEGPCAKYTEDLDNGHKTHKTFCPKCGSNIARQHEYLFPTIFVLGGTIDLSCKVKLQPPSLQVWTKRKYDWLTTTAPESHVEN